MEIRTGTRRVELTDTQRQVIVLAASLDYEGSYVHHVACVLQKNHRNVTEVAESAFNKLGVSTMPSAAAVTLERGIVTLEELVSASPKPPQGARSLVAQLGAEELTFLLLFYTRAREDYDFGKNGAALAVGSKPQEYATVISKVSELLGFQPNRVQLVVIGYACATAAEAISRQPA